MYKSNVFSYVKSQIGIIEVIGSFIPLEQKGSNWFGVCPFHHEKTPSLCVSPQRGIFKCFGCGEAGDMFSFVAKYLDMSNTAAMEEIARRFAIKLEPYKLEQTEEAKKVQVFSKMLTEVNNLFVQALNSPTPNGVPKDYWKSRGFDDSTIYQAGLGYCPVSSNGRFKDWLTARFPKELVTASGLLDMSGNCRLSDRYTIPIHDMYGNIVGFSGRSLNAEAKYLNSPSSEFFDKGSILYNFHNARKYNSVIIVEGYMDALAWIQSGYNNVVALMGTSLTDKHLTSLAGKKLILCLDNDSAGHDAMIKIIKNNNLLPIEVITFPEQYKDSNDVLLDSLVQGIPNFGLNYYYGQRVSAVDYLFKHFKKTKDLSKLQDRKEVYETIMVVLEGCTYVERDYYAKHLIKLLGLSNAYKKLKTLDVSVL